MERTECKKFKYLVYDRFMKNVTKILEDIVAYLLRWQAIIFWRRRALRMSIGIVAYQHRQVVGI